MPLFAPFAQRVAPLQLPKPTRFAPLGGTLGGLHGFSGIYDCIFRPAWTDQKDNRVIATCIDFLRYSQDAHHDAQARF